MDSLTDAEIDIPLITLALISWLILWLCEIEAFNIACASSLIDSASLIDCDVDCEIDAASDTA
jgi:hypothetical protein